MSHKHTFVFALLALMLALLACSAGGSGETTPKDPNILFQDDFSSKRGGWDEIDVSDGITDYGDGVYRIQINISDTDIWANPANLNFADTSISVDVTKVAGPDDNDFGLICRYRDNNNFYFGIISSDGYYAIGTVQGGVQTAIGQDGMQPATEGVIKIGSETNRLRFDCVGDTLSLYANEQLIVTVQDATLTEGNVGLLAGTFAEAGVEINFDNFIVRKP